MTSQRRLPFPSLVSAALLVAAASPLAAQRGAAPERRVTELENPAAFRKPKVTFTGPRDPRSLPPVARGSSLPAIVVTGYWPPSNEAARKFSDDIAQNPGGWQGANWEGRGYDIYSYFPEFTPPNCGFCGQGSGDLEVDYQDTTADFRPLVGQHDPIAVVTLSRGFPGNDWEVEMNQFNRSFWLNDYTSPFQPTPSPPDASVPAGTLRTTLLPAQDIVDAVSNAGLGLSAYICFSGDGGGFLSEFIAYQGVWYQDDHRSPALPDWCVTAGHIHIGDAITWPVAEQALEISLREVIAQVDATVANTVCQPDVAAGGPGTATLTICGDAMATGGTADLALVDAPPSTFAVIVAATNNTTPFAWKGGLVVPFPLIATQILPVDADGRGLFEGLPGGGGPSTIYTQVLYQDAAQMKGWGFTNTVAVDLLP